MLQPCRFPDLSPSQCCAEDSKDVLDVSFLPSDVEGLNLSLALRGRVNCFEQHVFMTNLYCAPTHILGHKSGTLLGNAPPFCRATTTPSCFESAERFVQ